MLMAEFFQWWYGEGWVLQARKLQLRLREVSQVFSVSILLRTLFAPWRRIVTAPGKGLDAHIHAAIDNAVGRLIGFLVRLVVLFTAGITTVALLLAGLVQLVLWPVLPFAAPALLILGVIR